MTLQPRDLKYKPLSPSDEFDKAALKQAIDTCRSVRELDISSKEGLEKYAGTIVGDKNALDSASPESVSASRNYVLSEHAQYEAAVAGKMFDSLDERIANNVFVFNPKMRLYKGGGDSYNAVVDAVKKAQEREEELKDPEKQRQVMKKELEGFNDYVKRFWLNFGNEILMGYIEKALDDAKQKLGECGGAKKFAVEHVKVMSGLAKEQAEKKSDLQGKVRKSLEEKAQELGRNPNAGESAEILERFKGESKELEEKYGNVNQDLAQYIGTLEAAWYQTNFPQRQEPNPAQNPEGNPQGQGNPESAESSEGG